MENITRNVFLLVSALTVGVNHTRGDDYNPDCRRRVWRKISEACSKQVADFLDEISFPVEKRNRELICYECVNRMTGIVKDYKESNEDTDYVKINHILNTGSEGVSDQVGILESKFKTILDENRSRLWGKCCYFAYLPTEFDWSLPFRAIMPALSFLDVCDRFQERYGCEMHAMHKRMMDPELYIGSVDSKVLRTLICGYERVSEKAALWESCHYCRPSREWTENDVWLQGWDKPMCEFLRSRKGKSEEEVFDAFVGYHDNAFVCGWQRPHLFEGDWWAETKPVKMSDPRVDTENVELYFRQATAWQYYHSAFANCFPSKYCDDDFKRVAETMVKRCTDSLASLYDELSKKREVLDPTLIWFLDKVLKPRVGAK